MIAIALTLAWLQTPIAIPAQEQSNPPASERKICRSGERRLGTKIVTPRRCKTASEWQEEDARNSGLPLSSQITQGQPDIPQTRPPQ